MIELIPAIDIIGGQCVRLTKGDYDQKTVYRDSPAEVAREFENIGFKRLHVVDLDGAKSKHIVNEQVLQTITAETHLTVDFGGGIKTDEDIEKAFTAGASMVTIGSIAVTNPDLFMGWLEKYGSDRIILGADVRHGKISINGWKEDSICGCRCEERALHGDIERRYPCWSGYRAIPTSDGGISRVTSDSIWWCILNRRHSSS